MSVVLDVKSLIFHREKVRAWGNVTEKFTLGPINLTVAKGESVAIIGENRSGKSLLAKILVGEKTADSGTVIVGDKTNRMSKYKHTKSMKCNQSIRMIFQHSRESMNPGLPVGKILEEPLKLNTELDKNERQEKIISTLTKVGLLREHTHYYRHMLSDGQQQRIAIARAILLNPKILIADEPFAALDPTIRSQTVNLLLEFQKELGMAFIFISHNLGVVRHIADRVVVMNNGQIVESGKTETIFRWPQHELTKKLITSYHSMIQQRSQSSVL